MACSTTSTHFHPLTVSQREVTQGGISFQAAEDLHNVLLSQGYCGVALDAEPLYRLVRLQHFQHRGDATATVRPRVAILTPREDRFQGSICLILQRRESGQQKSGWSIPTPVNRFSTSYNFSRALFLNKTADMYTADLSPRPVRSNMSSLRLLFCSSSPRNSLAHYDFSLMPVMSSVVTVVFHPRAQATQPTSSSL